MRFFAKNILLILLFLVGCNAFPNTLSHETFSSINQENILKDKRLNNELRNILKDNYSDFINNFEVYGELKKTPSGGFFTEGWMQDLRMENASALVVEPNGEIYAAWVIPENEKIEYRTNVRTARVINPYINKWSGRFRNISFDEKNISSNPAGDEGAVRHFNSEKFTINLTLSCSEAKVSCNDVLYEGKRNSDGAALKLKGKAVRSRCEKDIFPVNSYRFVNNGVVYLLDVHLSSLMIIDRNGKVLLNEKGSWSYGNK